ncbi:hypothetical protein BC332_04820 [Capsicum chinense]|nr:hypothetical protein BC332_04820 [Capsicum chinense]
MLMRATSNAEFWLVIVNGRAYVETYRKSFQSRNTFTLWGSLQMLRRYLGKVPDLDMIFTCGDPTVVQTEFYQRPKAPAPSPVFHYCSNDTSLDIAFPDWSFWGWIEINIRLSKELKEREEKMDGEEPYAYWKAVYMFALSRQESRTEACFKHSHLASQCIHNYKHSDLASQCILRYENVRYKIYAEGQTWSVSRGLMAIKQYCPIKDNDKCRSIKHAVDWGILMNKRSVAASLVRTAFILSELCEAQAIGKTANDFIQEQLKMDYVYDFMFHLLNEYSKFLKYKPTILVNAIELCSEAMACPAEGITKKFMLESMVEGPSDAILATCHPLSPVEVHSILDTKENSIKQVDSWEQKWFLLGLLTKLRCYLGGGAVVGLVSPAMDGRKSWWMSCRLFEAGGAAFSVAASASSPKEEAATTIVARRRMSVPIWVFTGVDGGAATLGLTGGGK